MSERVAKFQKLAMNARRAPEGVFEADAADEGDQLGVGARPAALVARLPSPPEAERLAVQVQYMLAQPADSQAAGDPAAGEARENEDCQRHAY